MVFPNLADLGKGKEEVSILGSAGKHMKIRNPIVIRWLAFLGSILLRIYMSTLCFRYRPVGINFDPWYGNAKGWHLFAFWHENILMPCFQYGRPDINILVSQHADGELIAQVLKSMGFSTIRGSTNRGGIHALRKMIAVSPAGNMVVIPDGPRGPRRTLELGLIYLASRSGLPIVPFGVGYDNPWRLPTWDRFAIPKPFSKAVIVTGNPIPVPANLRREDLESYRQKVMEEFNRVQARAEEFAGNPVPKANQCVSEARRAA